MNNNTNPVIIWFRDDLRLSDQPALRAAVDAGAPVLCIYIFDEENPGLRPLGGASRWWLHYSLDALGARIKKAGGALHVLTGKAGELVPQIAIASDAQAVYWTRRYGKAEIAIDTQIKQDLQAREIEARSFNGQLLFEPWELKTGAETPFKVFTPFWRAAMRQPEPAPPLAAVTKLKSAGWPAKAPARSSLGDLELLSSRPDWAGGLRETWTPGETGAQQRLTDFLDGPINEYKADRDRPAEHVTSCLSPHLRFGEISPRQIWHSVAQAREAGSVTEANTAKFLSEVGWREFSYSLLFHNPDLATKNFNPAFDTFPWKTPDPAHLKAWQAGRTGVPIVDAGMRELWQTGTMHNRVRMIVASFLIKNLLVDWREGERWFWDTLCDADPASNSASWQWVAGSGADAAPYFRIFNPVLQGEKFDGDGEYVRKYVPKLKSLPNKFIHKPWEAPPDILAKASVVTGKTYPAPLVDLKSSRDRALSAYKQMNRN